MIVDIPELVSRLMPGLLGNAPVSVASVWTAQPKYLVFGDDHERPACVIQVGPRLDLERLHSVLTRLHGLLPDVVAEPLFCGPAPWGGCDYVQIQTGLQATPWFRLTSLHRSSSGWARLRERALATLLRFHIAVSDVPDWFDWIHPGDELRRESTLCVAHGTSFSSRAEDCIASSADRLDRLGSIRSHWQHGDYCLNNLIISRSGIGIFDLDEFGLTCMPLHDQIGLAHSVTDLAPGGSEPGALQTNLEACLQALPDWIDPSMHCGGFYLHHLLWRINRCHGKPTRERTRHFLESTLESFASSPLTHFSLPRAATACAC